MGRQVMALGIDPDPDLLAVLLSFHSECHSLTQRECEQACHYQHTKNKLALLPVAIFIFTT